MLWLVFLVWPFIAFLIALSKYKYRTSRIIVYLFLVLYGLTFMISGVGVDSWEYTQKLVANAGRPFTEFWNIVAGLYAYDTSVDFVEPFISFIVSRVTSKHYILFGAYAAIFSFFYLKSVNFIHDRYINSPNITLFILMVCFTLVNPVFNINGFRFYTAAWIFFYGAYNFVLNKDKKYFFIALSSALVHFSFISAGFVLIVYFFAGNRNIIYLPVLLVSFVIPNLLAPYLNRLLPSLGSGLQNRIEGYTNEDYVQYVQESSASLNWFMQAENFILYFLIFAIFFLRLKYKEISAKEESANLFSFLLLFLSFVNFGKSIPSVGRFQTLFILFGMLYIILILVQIPVSKRYFISIVGLIPIILFSMLSLRIGLETVNIRLLEPFPFLFFGEDISLWRTFFY